MCENAVPDLGGAQGAPYHVWQFPSKEEEQHTFRTIPRGHW